MEGIQAIIRKWGDSIAVIIPKVIAKEKGLNPRDSVVITVEKESGLKDVFGSLKNWKINTQKLKDELRGEWN